MHINKDKLRELLNEMFKGNYNRMSKALNVSPPHLHKILNSKSEAGAFFLGQFMVYCNNNNLCFNDYIFLQKP